MQCATAILSYVSCLTLQNFSHYLINGTIFDKKLLGIKCVFWFSLRLLSETFFILRRPERHLIENVYWSSCKVSFIPVRFSWKLNFRDRFSKNIKLSNLVKIHPVGAKLFSEDGRKDMTKLIVAFRDFANAPKNTLVRCPLLALATSIVTSFSY